MFNKMYFFLWILPFGAFLGGYQALRFISHAGVIEVPSVVGMHIHDAIMILSKDKLNVRILAEKNDPDVQEGLIISQTPEKGQKVKPHQSIFLVLTRRPVKVKAPSLYALASNQAKKRSKDLGIELKIHTLENGYPQDKCFAQSVVPGEELSERRAIAYCSSGIKSQRIFPDLKGRPLDEVVQFFESYGIKVVADQQGSTNNTALITDQRPLAGSIVDITKGFSIRVTTV